MNPKSEKEVLSEYFYRAKDIWNEVDTLRGDVEDILNFTIDINRKSKEYNGEWPVRLDAMVGITYRILNKISSLADMYDNEEVFDE